MKTVWKAQARRKDVAAEMPLSRNRLRSEPQEVNTASGAVAMRRSGVAGRSVCAGRMPTLRWAQIHEREQVLYSCPFGSIRGFLIHCNVELPTSRLSLSLSSSWPSVQIDSRSNQRQSPIPQSTNSSAHPRARPRRSLALPGRLC